jgi:hypothetical protein
VTRFPLTVDAQVIEVPEHAGCGVCMGKPTGATPCPQCRGRGHLDFPPLPYCGTEGCTARSMELVAHTTGPEAGLPVYRCSANHYTAVRHVSVEGSRG